MLVSTLHLCASMADRFRLCRECLAGPRNKTIRVYDPCMWSVVLSSSREQTAWGESLSDDDEAALDTIETYLLERTKGGRRTLAAGEELYRAMPPLVRCVLEFADDQQLMMCMERVPGVPRERRLYRDTGFTSEGQPRSELPHVHYDGDPWWLKWYEGDEEKRKETTGDGSINRVGRSDGSSNERDGEGDGAWRR